MKVSKAGVQRGFSCDVIRIYNRLVAKSDKSHIFDRYSESPLIIKAGAFVFVTLICYQAYSASFQPFIYCQF